MSLTSLAADRGGAADSAADSAAPPPPVLSPVPAGLDPLTWRRTGRALVAKAIAELSYEEMLTPLPVGEVSAGTHEYRLALPNDVTYVFTARRGSFGAWRIDADSMVRQHDGHADAGDDPLRFVLDARSALKLDGPTMADLIRELTATHTADARLDTVGRTAAQLADAGYHELECYQQGHPCMLLNKGRIGFSAADLTRYPPEAGGVFRLPWIAVHPDLASYAGLPELTVDRLLGEELDDLTRARFTAALTNAGVTTADYIWLPVHPWHWESAVIPLFAPYLADGRMVLLGEAPDLYRPLQSIRTLTNVTSPNKRNVKLPLLIRNTLVWRGLSPKPTLAAPAVTGWVQAIREQDPFLQESGIVPLGEVASAAVRHLAYEEVSDAPYRYHELLGVVWREPVEAHLQPGERARTLASLLQVGADGRALVAELVERSNLDGRDWLQRLFGALLPGLLHYLNQYGVAFCPHGENTVVLYDGDDVPVRIAVKDFAEDINLLREDLPEYADLPRAADAVLLRWSAAELCHSIQSAIFAGHFRFFTDVAATHLGVSEEEFWAMVRAEVLRYQERFPELVERFAEFDLFTPEFDRISLNREQLLGGAFHDRADRDEAFDVAYGSVTNPLYQAPSC